MNKKRVILLSIILIITTGILIFAFKYFSYTSYRDTLANSNYLKWCQNVSVESVEIAYVSSGYGPEKVDNQLTDEDKTQLINVLREINVDDLSLTRDFIDLNKEGVNLYVRCHNGIEYVFKYTSETSTEVAVITTEENHDEFGDRNSLFVENQSLNSFIKSIDPRKP